MDNAEVKLNHFNSAIIDDARQEADAIYQEIKSESDAVMTAAEDDALAEAYRHIKTEVSRIEADCGRRLSRTVMDNKRELFLRREEMADEVMNEVREKLAAYIETPAYAEQLAGILSEVVGAFGGDTTVYLRPEDMPLAETLSKIPLKYDVTFAEGSFSLGGLEAACAGKKLHADETFDTRMYELRSHFSELFGLKLGE